MEQLTESQALLALAEQLNDGSQWCAHRIATGLQDSRVLPHGHPAMWQWGRTQVSLLVAMQRARKPSASVGEAVRDAVVDQLIAGSGGRITEER